jgi:O-methyltransferase involved in polyketide biosynthesis
VDADEVTSQWFDPDVPNVARIYDCLLGGKDHYPADLAAAIKIADAAPEVVQRVRENREFLGRVVRILATEGIRQFIDIGTGLPTQENVHQVARRVTPAVRVAYVDNDPVVVAHAQALLAKDENTIAVAGDMLEPATILRRVTEQGFIDLTQPVAILMLAVLHFIPDCAQAAQTVAMVREQIATGSYLVITHASAGSMSEGNLSQAVQTYASSSAGSITPRSHDQIEGFFDGLKLEEPGVVPVAQWRPLSPEPLLAGPATDWFAGGPVFLGGVGRNT